MLKIWGRTNSVNVQKVVWCADELGVPFDRVDAGLQHGVVGEEWFARMNPNRLVPVIDDDGFVLWESNATVRYLCARHGAGTLWPDDPRVRAGADRWMDWQALTVWPALRTVFWGLVRTPPEQRDPAAIEAARVKTGGILAILDRHLADRPFVAGDRLTMGDIPLGCAVQRWMALPIERPSQPNLEAWFARLRQRPAFARHVDLPLS